MFFFFLVFIFLLFLIFFIFLLFSIYSFLFEFFMEVSFYCVMCRSMVAVDKLRIPRVAVGRMYVSSHKVVLVAYGKTDEWFLWFFYFLYIYVGVYKRFDICLFQVSSWHLPISKYKVYSLLNFTVLLLKLISYYEQ